MKGVVNMEKIKRYIKKTWKNKLTAVLLLLLGIISAIIGDDSTALVMIIMFFVVPLWFAKDNIIK